MELFSIMGRIILQDGGVSSKLSAINGQAKSFHGSFVSGMSKVGNVAKNVLSTMAVAVGAGVTGVIALGKKSVEAYSDYEQLTGGVETLFKKSAPLVESYAANAYKTAGMSANEYMETVTGFSASLLQSVGGNTAKAAQVANMALTDMSDNANKMGTDMGSIQYAYQGFAKQNYTMLDNLKLGYGGTQEEMQRLLSDAQKITGVKYNIKNLNDVYQAIHVIQGQLGITGTTAKEASSTLQGSAMAMKSAWQNLLTGMADPTQNFDKLLQNVLDSAGTFAQNLLPRIEIVLGGVATLIAKLAPKVAEEIPKLVTTILPKLTSAAVAIVQSLVKGLSDNAPQLVKSAPAIIGSFANGIATTLPQVLNLAVKLILALAQGLSEHADQIVSGTSALISALVGGLLKAAPQLAQAAVQLAGAFFSALMKQSPPAGIFLGLIGAVKGLQGAFKGLDVVAGVVGKLQNTGGILSRLAKPFKQTKGNLDTIRDSAVRAGDKFKSFGSVVGSAASKAGGAISSLGSKVGSGLLSAAQKAGSAISGLGSKIGTGLLSAVKRVGSAFQAMGSFMLANPITIVIAAIAALVVALVVLYNKNKAFHDWVNNAVAKVKAVVLGAINGIKAGATALCNSVKSVFLAALNGVKGAWNSVTGFFSGIWKGISSVFSNVGGWFANIFGSAWSGIQNIWSKATGWFGNIWSGIKNAFKPNLISSAFGSAWSGIQGVWGKATGWFGNIWSGIKKAFKPDMISNGFRDAWGKIQGAWSNAGAWFGGVWQSIKNGFSKLNPMQWGKDLINNFVNGIKSGFQAVQNAVGWVADKIHAVLHHSRPDEGPLADDDTWMPDFMDSLVSGIQQNRYKLISAVQDVASDVAAGMKVKPQIAVATAGAYESSGTIGGASELTVVFKDNSFGSKEIADTDVRKISNALARAIKRK
mgnify:CR=1 FL=1|jgi:phage-related protein